MIAGAEQPRPGRPYKILNILYDERVGGPPLRVLQVARRLRPEVQTVVVVPTGTDEFTRMLNADGIPFYQIPLRRLRDSRDPQVHIRWLLDFWPSVRRLIKIIHAEQIDIVHTNGARHLQGAFAARFARTKLIWHLNDVHPSRLLRFFSLPFISLLPDRIAVASEAVAAHYFDAVPSPLQRATFTLYAPVDIDKFTPGRDEEIRREFHVDGETCLIGMVGNLNPIKGHRYFIEAAALVKEQVPHSKFLIVGKKLTNRRPYFDSLNRLARGLGLENDLIFAGRREDVPRILRALTLYVHPALAEACPMAVLEAMATAKPIVVTAVGGGPEVVGEAGVLVPPRDPEAMAQAIVELCRDAARAKQLGTKARLRVERLFSLRECVARHKDLYYQTLNGT